MRTRARLAVPLAAAALVLSVAACGGGGNEDGVPAPQPPTAPAPDSPPSSGAPIPGGGLSIDEALASTLTGPLMVKGYIVAPAGEPVRFCSALLESYPPQCGGPSLVVEGIDLSTVEGLTETSDPSLAQVQWSDAEVSLLGAVEDGTLTLSTTST